MVISQVAKEITGAVLAAFGAILMGGQHVENAIGRTSKSLEMLTSRFIQWPGNWSGLEFAQRWPWRIFFFFNWLNVTAALYALAAHEIRGINVAQTQWKVVSLLAALFVGATGSLTFIWITSKGDLPPSSRSGNRNIILQIIVRSSLLIGLPFSLIASLLLMFEMMALTVVFLLILFSALALCRLATGVLTVIRRTGLMFGYQSFLQQVGLAIFIVGTAIAIWGFLDPGSKPVPLNP
jgi:hypothetical protein